MSKRAKVARVLDSGDDWASNFREGILLNPKNPEDGSDTDDDPRTELLLQNAPVIPQATSRHAYWGFESALYVNGAIIQKNIERDAKRKDSVQLPSSVSAGRKLDIASRYDELLQEQLKSIKTPPREDKKRATNHVKIVTEAVKTVDINKRQDGAIVVNVPRRNPIVVTHNRILVVNLFPVLKVDPVVPPPTTACSPRSVYSPPPVEARSRVKTPPRVKKRPTRVKDRPQPYIKAKPRAQPPPAVQALPQIPRIMTIPPVTVPPPVQKLPPIKIKTLPKIPRIKVKPSVPVPPSVCSLPPIPRIKVLPPVKALSSFSAPPPVQAPPLVSVYSLPRIPRIKVLPPIQTPLPSRSPVRAPSQARAPSPIRALSLSPVNSPSPVPSPSPSPDLIKMNNHVRCDDEDGDVLNIMADIDDDFGLGVDLC